MGWKRVFREIERSHRRQERESARRRRELLKFAAQAQKMEEKAAAANEVAQYENYIEVITSVHRDCADVVAWQGLQSQSDPPPVRPITSQTDGARFELESYKPGFFAKLFGSDKRERSRLEAALIAAQAADAEETERRRTEHAGTVQLNAELRQLAGNVLSGDIMSWRVALGRYSPFEELESLGADVSVESLDRDLIVLGVMLTDDDIVPREELKLTAAGKKTVKDLADSKYWTIYQDFACGCALRVIAETFALLPIQRAAVNIYVNRLSSTTGRHQKDCLLALHATRDAFGAVRLANADASDATKNFQTRMKFKKGSGFDSVEAITKDDQWVTT